MVVNGIEGIAGAQQAAAVTPATKAANPANPVTDFSNILGDMVGKVNTLQQQAETSIQGLATGQSTGLHEVMLAVEKANISFQLLSQVRNKAVEAYQEVMRMQV